VFGVDLIQGEVNVMLSLLRYIKRSWNNYIKRLSKENEKAFAGGKLDCCKLNMQNSSTVRKKR
jgi:hypothetical protein